MPFVTHTCHCCQSTFMIKATKLTQTAGNYCSWSCYTKGRKRAPEERFWEKVARCNHETLCLYCCWPWQARCNNEGYGSFYPTSNKDIKAHRYAWELHNQQDMPKPFLACHWCHNPTCCNPLHIYKGTSQQNRQHSIHDGRITFPKGIYSPRARFTETDITRIRTLAAQGISNHTIAQQEKAHPSTIGNIVTGKSYPIET